MAILAIVGFGLAIYTGFFYEKRGELTILVDAVSRVFDVYQPVGGLEISYAGENLRTTKKALWIVSFTVINSGNAEIRKGDYDDQVPFGLQFMEGEVVETPTIKTKVEYLSHNLKVTTKRNSVSLSPVIFEPRDEVQISVLLLGSETTKPTIVPMGKIAGIRSINLTSQDGKLTERSGWAMITQADNLWVHPARAIVYSFGGLLAWIILMLIFIAVIFLPIERIKKWFLVSQRRKKVAIYRANEALDGNSRRLIGLYISDGADALKETAAVIDLLKRRTTLIESIQDRVDPEQLRKILRSTEPVYVKSSLFIKLKTLGLINNSELKITYAEGLEENLKDLSQFLEIDLSAKPNDQSKSVLNILFTSSSAEISQVDPIAAHPG